MRASLAAALAALAAACAGPHAAAGGRPDDCAVEFLEKPPERAYEVLRELSTTTTPPVGGRAVDALRAPACRLGADAVIVTRHVVSNERGHTLVAGTAIRYTAPPPPPAAGPPPAEPPPAPPTTPRPEDPARPPGSITL